MKKFLLVLLIAVALSSTVEFEESELNEWDWIDKIVGGAKKVIEWLKKNGWWDKIIDLIEKYGAPKAVEFCKEKLLAPWNSFCQVAIDKIIEWLRK